MSDNNEKEKEVIDVKLKEGRLTIEFNNEINLELLSYAIKLLELQFNNIIVAHQLRAQKNAEGIIKKVTDIPGGIISRMRGNTNGR